jgi:ATP-dependent helicase Lhr and Lhr-like helicase
MTRFLHIGWRSFIARPTKAHALNARVSILAQAVFSERRAVSSRKERKRSFSHPGGVVPRFEPSGGESAHDRLIAEMRAVYLAEDVPSYLDDKAQELLAEGRETFRQLKLERQSLVPENRDVHIFLWRGSQATAVFSAALAMAGLQSGVTDLGVSVSKIKENELVPILQKLAGMGTIDPANVAEFVVNIQAGKFREVVPEDLARALWARRNGGVVGGIASMAENLTSAIA